MSSKTSSGNASANRKIIYDMVLIAISAALITVCSWISLPIGPVPFTLQTLAILAVYLTIGGRRGIIATAIYLLLGTVGIPVFAGFKGGPAAIVGPTGGFLVGFVVSGLLFWLIEKLLKDKMNVILFSVIECVVFEVILYAVGVIWFMTVYAAKTGPIGLGAVMGMCVIPFIIPDIVKMAVAIAIGTAARKVVKD